MHCIDNGVRDRAYIFVNGEPRGILSRQEGIWNIPLSKLYLGDILQILVENQGRIGYGNGNVDFKGIKYQCTKWVHFIHHFSL